MTAVDWPAIIAALSVLVTALAAAFVSLRRQVGGVHTLVNSQLTEIKAALATAMEQRDQAIIQRDEARRATPDTKEQGP
jgi:hypothetical protein